jgi:putative transposase
VEDMGTSRRVTAPQLNRPESALGAIPQGGGTEAFAGTWEDRYPVIIKLWRAHWEQITLFLAFPPDVRRVVYATDLIESMNARLRKVTGNCGQFPSERAALKVLYLAVRNLEEFRSPNVGIRSSGWNRRCKAFTIYFDGRIPTP